MTHPRHILAGSTLAVLGAVLFVLAYPHVLPLFPGPWQISASEARTIALEALRDLGEPVADPYVVVRIRSDASLERRLGLAVGESALSSLRSSRLAQGQTVWDVLVYPPGARPGNWAYRAFVSPRGEILMLRVGAVEADGSAEPDDGSVRRLGAAYLAARGFDLSLFESPGEVRRGELTGGESDVRLQLRDREAVLGEEMAYGVEVYFAGRDVAGFGLWYDEPQDDGVQDVFRQAQILNIGAWILIYVILPLVAVPFLRRYHDGQLGVRRGLKLFLGVLAAGLVATFLNRHGISEDTNIGLLTRRQTTWFIVLALQVFYYFGAGVLALMAWSVGENLWRRRAASKLASFDALFRLRWDNATVARASLLGVGGGLLMAGLLLAFAVAGQDFDAWAASAAMGTEGLGTVLGWLGDLADAFADVVPLYLFAGFFLPAWVNERFGRGPALVAAYLGLALLAPEVIVLPLPWGWAMWAVVAIVPVLLFHLGDLLAMLLAAVVARVALAAAPALFADDPLIELGGAAALFFVASPLILSLRSLFSGEEFTYHYDDIPPHVRRIAERERQRVELETAAEIQSSILPHLPPQLNGVEIASAYLPATEVGGDFYDVLALDDGRLAVAVGDVAGHGVSSGLVMSMAKSALAVQVTFDPNVAAVFKTLNRMVYQSARRRLLATLCYLLVDPERLKLTYASAGHLYPYRINHGGEIEGLETASYPLGVRGTIDVVTRTAPLGPSDTIFLCSDGLVEAQAENGDDDPFGFDRLEACLRVYAGRSPQALRDAILRDVEEHVGGRPWEDDLTILVLRLPAA